jgi:hypothetical protein
MEDLLLQFSALFATPFGLPPPRPCNHQIRLLPGTAPVVVWQYRYAHAQKELERQCEEMMCEGVIWPSTSVLLVKKGDNSWRFCGDYRALNAKMAKDKFPIPVVEELVDELRDAVFFTKLDLH